MAFLALKKFLPDDIDPALVCGIDEVGRGPWAGPLVACALMFCPTSLKLPGLNESKQLSATEREKFYEILMREADVGVGISTVEEIELLDIVVVKKDGQREAYSRNKMSKGILQSLTKRPFTQEKFDFLIHAIERDIQKKKKREVTSKDIGEIVMKQLKKFDTVAYIRFASIYRAFEDVKTFESEIQSLKSIK